MGLLVILASFIAMEFAAWLSHRYLMHGLLWSWHEDHHKPSLVTGFFHKNDRFFFVFAVPSFLCFLFGSLYPSMHLLTHAGFGILLYGIIYFLFHDVYIHQRFKWFKKLDNRYFRAMKKAHAAHHSVKEKDGCICFGLLVFPTKFFKRTKTT